jgi:hypothetical protein
MIDNVSATPRAARVLKKAWEAYIPRAVEAFALVFCESYVNPDGTTVEGFQPGYVAGPLRTKGLSKYWLLAHLPDGIEFYFHPRSNWDPQAKYLVDLQGAMFSISRLN